MFRFAEDTDIEKSLLGPLDEFQGRFRLEVPKAYIKEERSREASDQQSATHTIVWYDTENMRDSEEEPLDLEPIIEELAETILGDKDYLEHSVSHDRLGRHKFQSIISVNFKKDEKEKTGAVIRLGQDIVPAGDYPASLYIGDDVFGIDSDDGLTYRITQNGEVIEEDYESAPMAFGRLLTLSIEKLKEVEASKGREDQLDVEQDLLIGIAGYFLDSETIPEDAKIHLVDFVELTTNKDLEAALDEVEEHV